MVWQPTCLAKCLSWTHYPLSNESFGSLEVGHPRFTFTCGLIIAKKFYFYFIESVGHQPLSCRRLKESDNLSTSLLKIIVFLTWLKNRKIFIRTVHILLLGAIVDSIAISQQLHSELNRHYCNFLRSVSSHIQGQWKTREVKIYFTWAFKSDRTIIVCYCHSLKNLCILNMVFGWTY